MTIIDTNSVLATKHKSNFKKSVLSVAVLLGCALIPLSSANAASEITINQPVTGSTTVVEQYSDGNIATITATPNGISMQNGMPYSVTQVTNVPRYTVSQESTTVVSRGPISSQVTQQIGNTLVTTPVNTPMTVVTPVSVPLSANTQVMVPISTTTIPVINNQVVASPVITNPVLSNPVLSNPTVMTVDALQLNPTFSTPGVVSANTKVMKILKDGSGRDFAVPANSIKPGDTIEYHTTYINTSNQPINDINAMVTLPNGVRMVSLNSSIPTLATTGGDNYQTIQQVGNSVVVTENYSGLKWNLVDLANNAPQTVVIRAKVQ